MKVIMRHRGVQLLIGLIIVIALTIATHYNDQLYSKPIGKITNVETIHKEKEVDDHHNHDIDVTQKLHVKVLNGKYKDKTATITNKYTQSKADTQDYKTGQKVFLHIKKDLKDMYILDLKRDAIIVFMTGIAILALILLAQKLGVLALLSLGINGAIFICAIALKTIYKDIPFLALVSVAVVIATTFTMLLVTGWNKRTLVNIVSTLLGTLTCMLIAIAALHFTNSAGIRYETLSFLTLPPRDVFLSSVLIGCLGAVMDVAITISSGMYEILRRTPDLSNKRWIQAGRNIGQDIMGTMTNILLFSYLAGSLPMVLLYIENGNTITYTLSLNWSLEFARAIIGDLGIVLTIPITIALMQIWRRKRGDIV